MRGVLYDVAGGRHDQGSVHSMGCQHAVLADQVQARRWGQSGQATAELHRLEHQVRSTIVCQGIVFGSPVSVRTIDRIREVAGISDDVWCHGSTHSPVEMGLAVIQHAAKVDAALSASVTYA